MATITKGAKGAKEIQGTETPNVQPENLINGQGEAMPENLPEGEGEGEGEDLPEGDDLSFQSDNLTTLRAQRDAILAKIAAGLKVKEAQKTMLQLFDATTAISNEIAGIKKAQRLQEIEDTRNKEIARFNTMFDLYDKVKAIEATLPPVNERKDGDLKDYTAAKVEFDNLKETYLNRVLGSPAKVATVQGEAKGKGGKISEQIRELIAPMYATHSPAQIRAFIIKDKGFNDGTANAVIHAYEVEQHLNGK
jgi:hypothetical protein